MADIPIDKTQIMDGAPFVRKLSGQRANDVTVFTFNRFVAPKFCKTKNVFNDFGVRIHGSGAQNFNSFDFQGERPPVQPVNGDTESNPLQHKNWGANGSPERESLTEL